MMRFMIKIIITILRNQKYEGNAIIKIKDTLHKPVVDCLYLLTSFYDKVYIVKPNTISVKIQSTIKRFY